MCSPAQNTVSCLAYREQTGTFVKAQNWAEICPTLPSLYGSRARRTIAKAVPSSNCHFCQCWTAWSAGAASHGDARKTERRQELVSLTVDALNQCSRKAGEKRFHCHF